MSKAKSVIKVMEQVQGSTITSADQLKQGDWVMFGKGHELEGTTGLVLMSYPAEQSVDLKVGKATKIRVPISDLVQIPIPGGDGQTKGNADAPAAVTSAPAGDAA